RRKRFDMQLKGKTAIVTGAGTGLGRGTAEVFAREGANVVMVGRRLNKLDEVAGPIRDKGGVALSVSGDVSDPEAVRNIVARAKAGMVNLTRATALEYLEHGIRVNVVCVGGIDPGYTDDRHYTPEERVFMAAARGSALPIEGPYLAEGEEPPPRPRTGVSPWDM